MEKKKQMSRDKFTNIVRQTLSRKDIMTFVSGLHDIQMDMIETTVMAKERQGFPEANMVIKHIMEKK
jgi:hypothetical protein